MVQSRPQLAYAGLRKLSVVKAAVYALLGAITGWLKYYYPVEFMAETMNIFIHDTPKLNAYLAITSEMGIKLLPPDINKSKEEFTKEGENIRFGLKGIRNMGKTSDAIIFEKNTRGEFLSYQDFVVRMGKYQKINKSAIEGSIYSGALDEFEGTRRAKIEIIPQLTDEAKIEKEAYNKGQVSIFDVMPEESHLKEVKTPNTEEYDKRYKLEKEKEFAGFYLSEHPLDDYVKYFKGESITEIRDLVNLDNDEEEVGITDGVKDGTRLKIAGIITDKKVFWTKKGDKLFTFTVEGKGGSIKCVMFSNIIDRVGEKVENGNIVIIEGIFKIDDFGTQIIANEVKDITNLGKTEDKALVVRAINDKQLNTFVTDVLSRKEYLGEIPVYASIGNKKFKSDKKINLDIKTISMIKNIFSDYEIIEM